MVLNQRYFVAIVLPASNKVLPDDPKAQMSILGHVAISASLGLIDYRIVPLGMGVSMTGITHV